MLAQHRAAIMVLGQPARFAGGRDGRSGREGALEASTQLAKLTASETHRMDRAIVAISVNPELGSEVTGTLLRDYVDEIDGVRVIYYVTALGSITIVG